MAQNPRTSESDSTPLTGRNAGLTRRNYVRSLAAAATATAAVGASGVVSASDDYEVIEAANQTITIESGETWENKLVDMTTGQDITISAQGSDWTIRNVGFEGENSSDAGSGTFGLSDSGGESTVENVYLGDGSTSGNAAPNGHGETAFWVNPDHAGHIDVENVNIQGFADNAIYASAPGNAGGGTVHVDGCFAANCYVSHYRLATEGSKVTDSVVYIDDDGYAGRGIWAWAPGTIEVDNCQLATNGQHSAIVAGANGQATTVEVRDTDYDEAGGIQEDAGSSVDLGDGVGTDPEPYIPDGVPTSAEEAARGE